MFLQPGDECVFFWSYGRVKVLVQNTHSYRPAAYCNLAIARKSFLCFHQQYQPRSTPVTARADYRTRLTNQVCVQQPNKT